MDYKTLPPIRSWNNPVPSWQMTEDQYLWAYIHWLEDWIKSLSQRINELEKAKVIDAESSEKP
jgi:hypothetical protein